MSVNLNDLDVKKSLQDTGYVAVGVGVIGFQQAQKGARAARSRWETARERAAEALAELRGNAGDQLKSAQDRLGSTTRDARSRTVELRSDVRSRVGSIGDEVRTRADGLTHQARIRLEPVVDQLQQLPDQAVKVVEQGRTRVQDFVPSRSTSRSTSTSSTSTTGAASSN